MVAVASFAAAIQEKVAPANGTAAVGRSNGEAPAPHAVDGSAATAALAAHVASPPPATAQATPAAAMLGAPRVLSLPWSGMAQGLDPPTDMQLCAEVVNFDCCMSLWSLGRTFPRCDDLHGTNRRPLRRELAANRPGAVCPPPHSPAD